MISARPRPSRCARAANVALVGTPIFRTFPSSPPRRLMPCHSSRNRSRVPRGGGLAQRRKFTFVSAAALAGAPACAHGTWRRYRRAHAIVARNSIRRSVVVRTRAVDHGGDAASARKRGWTTKGCTCVCAFSLSPSCAHIDSTAEAAASTATRGNERHAVRADTAKAIGYRKQ